MNNRIFTTEFLELGATHQKSSFFKGISPTDKYLGIRQQ
jgi:hypothetical protein